MKNLVSTDWLKKNLDNVRIFDGSWHLPSSNRNALDEFKSAHIKNSNFFIQIMFNNTQNFLLFYAKQWDCVRRACSL
jgi:3-mercaptopyruvate sulfurtransferase SseA